MKEKASRNRTLTLSEAEEKEYSSRLKTVNGAVFGSELLNTTINQDIFEIIDFLPSEFADLIIIDPPYNMDKDFRTIRFKHMDDEQYAEYLRSWLPKIVRLLKPNGSLYICCDWKSTAAVYQVMSENISIKSRITWQREKGRGAKANWKNSMEDIWFGVKNDSDYYFDVDAVKLRRRVIAAYKENGKPKDWEVTETGNFRLTHPSNFWDDISVPYWSMHENTDHPTQKPEKLVAKMILASCPEGGVVFDPFVGSGTSSVVAKKLGRNYCGVEINTQYALWTEKRLDMADCDKGIQGYCGQTFWERNTLNEQRSFMKDNPDQK